MSFSRAPLKRFNDSMGCAPAPGAYDVKPGEVKGPASFDKSDRFKAAKAGAPSLIPPPSPSRNLLSSPFRRTMSVDGLVDGSSVKKDRPGISADFKKHKLLEKEIRSLVQQRGEQDSRLQAVEEQLKKVEAKLLVAVREKTGLSASVTTLERQQAELRKINEFLKNKVSADTTKKRINSLTMELMEARNNLDAKNKEMSILHINNESQMKVLETDVQTVKASVTCLKNRNKDLEDLQQVTKAQNVELEKENAKLQAIVLELREEIRVLQEYLDKANEEIQDLRLKLEEQTEAVQNVSGSQLERERQLETELEHRAAELQTAQLALKQKEEESQTLQRELRASKEALAEAEQKLESQAVQLESSRTSLRDAEAQLVQVNRDLSDSGVKVRQQEIELLRLREVLRRTEQELDERVAHLEQRCLFSEEERNKTQEEGLRRVEELRTELNLLKEEKRKQAELQREHANLTEELEKEKKLVDSLSVLLEQEREEAGERERQLKDELEEVMGEIFVLEEEEQRRLEVLQKLQEENKELDSDLSSARVLLDGSSDVAALEEKHKDAMRKLQEEHATSANKMADIVGELNRTKEALEAAEERHRKLEAEVEGAKEDTERVVRQKEEEIQRAREEAETQRQRCLVAQRAEVKAREEHAGELSEARAGLAQKDEEMKAASAGHEALISQLQQETRLQTAARAQAETERAQIANRLREEREEAREALERAARESEGLLARLHLQKEEKAQAEGRLREARGELEAERGERQRWEGEAARLRGLLEGAGQEKERLLLQVELTDGERSALQERLRSAEEEKELLRSALEEARAQMVDLQARAGSAEEERSDLQMELERRRQDSQALEEQVKVMAQEKVTLQWEMEEQRLELQRQLEEAQQQSSQSAEMEEWRRRYEELFAKVRPFQEQLNGFAAERDALLNENGANQEELNRLADAYARLLGHHNQKQKIKHVMKLKDENISLKTELTKLRSLAGRQKSELEQARSMLPGAPRRRFDPSKAFQHHNKENEQREATAALREGIC